MTDKIEVEFVGGPSDGQREHVLPGPDGVPAAWLDVPVPARLLRPSALDDAPAGPPPLHRYELDPAASAWLYRHRGPAT